MADENTTNKIPSYDLVLPVPKDYKEPLYLKNGELLSEGDCINHCQFGTGKVLMIVTLDGEGPFAYIEFDGLKENRRMIDPMHADLSKVAAL